MPSTHSVSLLGVIFPVLDYQKVIKIFQRWIVRREQPHQVCIANVHTLVSSLTDPELRTINNNALTTMDGMPLVWYARWVYGASAASRVCGPDLMLKCLESGVQQGWSHFFLGGTPPVLADLVTRMTQRYPGIKIAGWHSPPFRTLLPHEDDELVAQINAVKPDFLWVGLGAPKQEKWIAAHLSSLHVPVQIGVGAAFDFHSGHIIRAPQWMQQCGLEWLYRMYRDKRLCKRYAQTNPIFLWWLVKDYVLIRLLKLKS